MFYQNNTDPIVGILKAFFIVEMFLTMSKQIGLPIKADKTVFPTTTLTFLGLDLDSELMEIRLPLDKLGNVLSK
jgi:hypothetical protein